MVKRVRQRLKDLSFIERACGSDERLILGARIHWIYLVIGACWMLAFFALGAGITHLIDRYAVSNVTPGTASMIYLLYKGGHYAQIICACIGVLIFLCYFVTYDTTRIGLTTKRLILRRGLIFVKLVEVDLEEIKGESVDHGMLGRFLDYGELVLDARFVKDFTLPSIADPYRLLRAIHEVRAKVGDTIGNPPLAAPAPFIERAPAQPRADALPAPYIEADSVQILDETDNYVIYKRRKTLPCQEAL